LFDPARSSPDTERGVFGTVAHEIAHQWFGNLVTAASWDEIWLNEAFATWMANKAMERFNPLWHTALERRFPLDWTMAGDAGDATRAIRSGPVSEASVFDVFDGITYVKGGAVLGMIEQWVGEEQFRRGLAAYMRERKFSNATAGDLWYHMAQASQSDVAAVAASWTDQPGYPLLEVASVCEGQQTRVTVSQRRMRDGAAPSSTASAGVTRALWQVPVRLARGSEMSTVLLVDPQQSFALSGCSGAPVVANAGGIGFYRVKYGEASAGALTQNFARLAPADQVALLSDTFALAQAGELSMTSWFALVKQISQVAGPALLAGSTLQHRHQKRLAGRRTLRRQRLAEELGEARSRHGRPPRQPIRGAAPLRHTRTSRRSRARGRSRDRGRDPRAGPACRPRTTGSAPRSTLARIAPQPGAR